MNIAVIDAAFGDCGKGLMTDFHAAALGGANVTVVRFNGGAQAGHTVVAPNGSRKRHIFSHVGSGALVGAATYLSRFFITNPILLATEMVELRKIACYPAITIDARSPVTTPWDMLLNHLAERARERNGGRHGSVGVGINETVTRHETIPLTVGDLGSGLLPDIMRAIERDWVPGRAAALGIEPEALAGADIEGAMQDFSRAVASFDAMAETDHSRERPSGRNLIFEGAQGLLLDERHPFFPHVTRSRTGMPNVAALAADWGIDEIEINYVLRAYMTRHGAGPFPTEEPGLQYEDQTNVPGEHQGSLRFGYLDVPLIAEAIAHDMAAAGTLQRSPAMLTMTHMDQVGPRMLAVVDQTRFKRNFASAILPNVVAGSVPGLRPAYMSCGPTRGHVGSAVVRKVAI